MAQKYLQHILLALFTFTLGVALVGAIYWQKTANLLNDAPQPMDMPPLRLEIQAQLAPTEENDSEPKPFDKEDAAPCRKDYDTRGVTECYDKELRKENIEMARLNRKLLENWTNRKDASLRNAFKTAQKAWLEYREKDCDVVSEEWGGGPSQGPAHLFCLWLMTKERNDDLRDHLWQYYRKLCT